MTKIKNLLEEVKNIIQALKTNTNLTGQTKTDLEKRIDHILDKSNPRHTNLTQDLEIDLKELAELEKALGTEKLETAQKQKELADKNKQLETDNQTKDQQIKEKDEKIGQKITKELIDKLTNLEPGKIDETKLAELKTLLEKVAKKEVKTDLTEIDKKIEEMGKKVEGVKPPPNY
jgi:hypothetical protein